MSTTHAKEHEPVQHSVSDMPATPPAAAVDTAGTATTADAAATAPPSPPHADDVCADAASVPVMAEPSQSFLRSDAAAQLPQHLLPLAYTIRKLNLHDFVHIAHMVNTVAKQDVYSMLPYTGCNWFLPAIRACRDDEPHWQLRYAWHDGLVFAVAGRRVSVRLLSIALRFGVIVLTWFMLWCMLPSALVEPGGYVWDPVVLVVVAAIVGGAVCRVVQFPPLVGVLWMGILWNNVPRLHYLTAGIDAHVFAIAAKLGLTVILLRAGYSISLSSLRPHWKQSVMLCTLPFACEGVVHSAIARPLFGYTSNHWAFLQGMLCSIASPAVVVPGSLYLQELGYGRGVSPLSLMLSAVGVEIVLGVWCANFLIGLIFAHQSLPVAIVLGPVQFVVGVLLGVVFGVVYHYAIEIVKGEATRLPNGMYERAHMRSTLNFGFALFLIAAFTMVFLGYRVNLAGGGCVMTVFFAATVAHMWSRAATPEMARQKRHLAQWLATTWNGLMMPVLFATMGAKIDVTAVFNRHFFARAVVCLSCSSAVRVLVTTLLLLRSRFTWRERVVVCIGYLGKASAQASMGPIAVNLVAELVQKAMPSERAQYASMITYADTVQQMSALYVMFMAVIASVGLVHGGQRLLTRDTAPTTTAAAATAHASSASVREQHTGTHGNRGGDDDGDEDVEGSRAVTWPYERDACDDGSSSSNRHASGSAEQKRGAP